MINELNYYLMIDEMPGYYIGNTYILNDFKEIELNDGKDQYLNIEKSLNICYQNKDSTWIIF